MKGLGFEMMTKNEITEPMHYLLSKIRRTKRNPVTGYVVFVKKTDQSVAQRMHGLPLPTEEAAIHAAREMLASPLFSQAWIVNREIGVREVTA